MSDYKGKLHETAVRFPQTHIWMDSCGEEELDYGLERGIVSATSNPSIVYGVMKKELPRWESRIREMIRESGEATEDEITWALLYEMAAIRSKKLLPIFERTKGRQGRLSLQTNAKFYRNAEKILQQGLEIHRLAPNMQVKAPANEAGIRAMEELTYHGVSINATISFTVPQAIAVAKAVERGLQRRESEGQPVDDMAPVCTIMMGRTDDWMKESCNQTGLLVRPECLEWAGIAVIKRAYGIYRERGYRTRLLSAANRNVYHWSELVGGDLSQTINYGWQKRLEFCDMTVESRMDIPVRQDYLEELRKIPEFLRSYEPEGMTVAEFGQYGGFRDTLTTFLAGYDDLCKMIRGLMI